MVSMFQQIPGLSKTLNLNFQEFPVSRTKIIVQDFTGPGNFRKKIPRLFRTFQEA